MIDTQNINPLLTPQEQRNVFSLFYFLPQTKKYAKNVEILLNYLNTLPCARPVLRQLTKPLFFQVEALTVPAVQTEKGITFCSKLIQKPSIYGAITLLHEIAHFNDKHHIYPFVLDLKQQNDSPIGLQYQLLLSEKEILKLSFLDEADKNALSLQAALESRVIAIPDFYKNYFEVALLKHKRMLNKTPSTESRSIQQKNQLAHFYSSLETRAYYITSFMQPETHLYRFLPPICSSAVTNTNLGKLIDLKKISPQKIQQEKNIRDILDEIQLRLTYREQGLLFLLNRLKKVFIPPKKTDIHTATSATRHHDFNLFLLNINERSRLMPNHPTQNGTQIENAFQERYMGFLNLENTDIFNHPSLVYLNNASHLENPLVQIGETLHNIKKMQTYWTEQEHFYKQLINARPTRQTKHKKNNILPTLKRQENRQMN